MKFGFKTYLYFLVLFLVLLNGTLCFLMYITYGEVLQTEKERAVGDQYFIMQSLKDDIDSLSVRKELDQNMFQNLMQYYTGYHQNQKIYFVLSKGKEVVFNNTPFSPTVSPQIQVKNVGGQQVSILNAKQGKYILVFGEFNTGSGQYSLVYSYRLESVMRLWEKLNRTIICMSIFVSLLMGIIMYFLLKKRLEPLKQLMVFVNAIKEGDYVQSIRIAGNDEFSKLGESFNEMSEEINENLLRMRENIESKQQFIDNLAHELRTPLTSIYGYAEYIQKASISEEEKYESTLMIMKESRRLQYMSTRLLEMIMQRNLHITKEKIEVDDFLEELRFAMLPFTKEKNISIHVNNSLRTLVGERPLLQSLFFNLLENGIKASSPQQWVEIRGFEKNEEGVIQIIDHGKGIPKEDIQHLMEPLYRVDKSRSQAEGGTGLGLYICKQIVELHGGRIHFDSEVGKGTTVSVIFTTS